MDTSLESSHNSRAHKSAAYEPISTDTPFVQEQISRFGRSQWENDLVRLADVKTLPGTALKGPTLQRAIWKALPNSKLKRFQEVFSDNETVVVPKPTVQPDGTVGFSLNREAIKALSVRGTIVHPEHIPDHLFETLGFPPSDNIQTLIAQLKMLWDATHPFKRTELRLLVVEPASRDLQREYNSEGYPPVVDPPMHTYGTLLMTRQKPGKSSGIVSPKIIAHYEGMYSAHRKTLYQEKDYTRETIDLSGLRAELGRFADVLRREWKRDTADDIKSIFREEATDLSERSLSLLHGCKDKYKIASQDLLSKIENASDSLGRSNPFITIKKIDAALRILQKRVADVRYKSGYNDRDRRMLDERVGRSEQFMKGFRIRIEDRAGILDDQPMKARLLSRQGDVPQPFVRAIMARLGIHRNDLLAVRMRPSRTFARVMRDEIGILEESLSKGDLFTAKRSLRHLQIVAKLHSAVVGIEHLKAKSAVSAQVPFGDLIDFASSLRDTLLSPRLFPQITASKSFQPLQRRLKGVVESVESMPSKLQSFMSTPRTVETEDQARKLFRKLLDKVEIEGDLRPDEDS